MANTQYHNPNATNREMSGQTQYQRETQQGEWNALRIVLALAAVALIGYGIYAYNRVDDANRATTSSTMSAAPVDNSSATNMNNSADTSDSSNPQSGAAPSAQ